MKKKEVIERPLKGLSKKEVEDRLWKLRMDHNALLKRVEKLEKVRREGDHQRADGLDPGWKFKVLNDGELEHYEFEVINMNGFHSDKDDVFAIETTSKTVHQFEPDTPVERTA